MHSATSTIFPVSAFKVTHKAIIIIIIIIIRNLYSAIMPSGGYRGNGGTGR